MSYDQLNTVWRDHHKKIYFQLIRSTKGHTKEIFVNPFGHKLNKLINPFEMNGFISLSMNKFWHCYLYIRFLSISSVQNQSRQLIYRLTMNVNFLGLVLYISRIVLKQWKHFRGLRHGIINFYGNWKERFVEHLVLAIYFLNRNTVLFGFVCINIFYSILDEDEYRAEAIEHYLGGGLLVTKSSFRITIVRLEVEKIGVIDACKMTLISFFSLITFLQR